MIDGRTCNAGETSGCQQTPATVTVGDHAFAVAVNPVTETIYVANRNDNTISVIDGRTCNGSDTAGCDNDWPTVAVGASPQALCSEHGYQHDLRGEHQRQHGLGGRRFDLQWLRRLRL